MAMKKAVPKPVPKPEAKAGRKGKRSFDGPHRSDAPDRDHDDEPLSPVPQVPAPMDDWPLASGRGSWAVEVVENVDQMEEDDDLFGTDDDGGRDGSDDGEDSEGPLSLGDGDGEEESDDDGVLEMGKRKLEQDLETCDNKPESQLDELDANGLMDNLHVDANATMLTLGNEELAGLLDSFRI